MLLALTVFVLIGQSNLTRDDGVAVGLAQRWGELTGEPVEVINCAAPNTRVGQWVRSWVRTTLYADCLAKIGTRRVDGLVWWEGENAATKEAWAQTWAQQFVPIVAGLRQDLEVPLPTAVAVLHGGPQASFTPWWSTVRALQLNLQGPRLTTVPTDGVNYPDRVHADYAGHVEIGRRFAEGLSSLAAADDQSGR